MEFDDATTRAVLGASSGGTQGARSTRAGGADSGGRRGAGSSTDRRGSSGGDRDFRQGPAAEEEQARGVLDAASNEAGEQVKAPGVAKNSNTSSAKSGPGCCTVG